MDDDSYEILPARSRREEMVMPVIVRCGNEAGFAALPPMLSGDSLLPLIVGGRRHAASMLGVDSLFPLFHLIM